MWRKSLACELNRWSAVVVQRKQGKIAVIIVYRSHTSLLSLSHHDYAYYLSDSILKFRKSNFMMKITDLSVQSSDGSSSQD